MMDWIMTDRYEKLKEEAQQLERWRRRTFDPTEEAENLTKKRNLLSGLKVPNSHIY